ncbi:OmpA/MotB family protein [Azohydromonas lata]|uniref:OmpA family protein n=1 Tax=Azohydromonas lata TaxID=45677 RepID=A0ABU5IDU1_9BURK|nr:OmpA family protein [Azohydromonas lata]MDZ5456138.1 OmpA family protein [Azohydromonas lata]
MATQDAGTPAPTPPTVSPAKAAATVSQLLQTQPEAPFTAIGDRGWRPKEQHDEEESGSERWLVSYADFITLLMVMFMMLYALQLVKNKDVVMSDLVRQDKTQATQNVAAQNTQDEKAAALMENLTALGDNSDVKLSRTAAGVEISLNARLLFASGDARLLPAALPVLKSVTKALKDVPRNNILVQGHTDSQPISNGRFESNWELSSARAGVVVRYLVEHGIEPYRLASMGRADNVPAALGDTPEAYAANRRVTILVQY